ncbi:MAG: ABC transporter [Nitrosomonas sp.]|nr:ABC transporter [Nitrosomonas sp.]TXI43042.1 MAG: ABC transporter [Nitrosomonas sp.]
MSTKHNKFERGAEWRRWDLHVHTPESHLGNSFTGVAWDDYVDALERAANHHQVAVIGITDYMTIDGYEILRAKQKDASNPRLESVLLIPNIEFRCSPQTKEGQALNIHLLVNVNEDDHIEKIKRSLRNLKVTYKNQTYGCIKEELIDFAKAQNPALSDDVAYKFGIEQFKPSHTEIFSWLDADGWLKANSVVGVANGKDGISGLPLDSFAATRDELLSRSDFVFSGNPADRLHYLGLKPSMPADEIRRQYNSLKPCFHGSDAHAVDKLFEPDSKRYCWVKADPTFLGLLQTIKEPVERTYIGEMPQKLGEVAGQRTFFIDRIEIQKNEGSLIGENWLDKVSVPLNSDLVAIIGNKGSGKSALADVIALLGNSKSGSKFSFLQKNRFRGKSGDPAKQFTGVVSWLSGVTNTRNLNSDPDEGSIELVRYIPQGRFEDLCNDHISGKSNLFQTELQNVIFDHANDELRLGALDFDQLVERQEGGFRDQLIEYRKELTKINRDIESLEAQSQPQVRRSLEEFLELKKKQIEEHNATKPAPLPKPSEQLSPEQQDAATKLEAIAQQIKGFEEKSVADSAAISLIASKRKAAQSIRDRIRLLERQVSQFQIETESDFQILGLKLNDLVQFSTKLESLIEMESTWEEQHQVLVAAKTTNASECERLLSEQASLKTKLNQPQLEYQQNLKAIEQWSSKLQELTGVADAPESLSGLSQRISQLDELPQQLLAKKKRRKELAGEIFEALDAQRAARERLFKPVQELIQGNQLIRDDYRLQFQATLGGTIDALSSELFDLIKKTSGEFSGEDESYAAVRRLSEQYDLSKKEDALGFIDALDEKIKSAASKGNSSIIGLTSILRKDRQSSAVYDLLYGLSYLEPRYTLLFQDAHIEQLSPGQRGALLLIFYLLVDKGRNPIILDQPEENLDNETVVSLLVPVLTEAKRKRQIIMVTHNPNLAVVCDAEQVIYSSFDRKNGFKITYLSGSIESPALNTHVVNVLEGTKPAFDNRRIKYH